jgi:hypothetical protein
MYLIEAAVVGLLVGLLVVLIALTVAEIKRGSRLRRGALARPPAPGPSEAATGTVASERVASFTGGAESPVLGPTQADRANPELTHAEVARVAAASGAVAEGAVATAEEDRRPPPEQIAEELAASAAAHSGSARRARATSPRVDRRPAGDPWRRVAWLVADALPAVGDLVYYAAALVLAVAVGLAIAYVLGGGL